MPPFTLFNQQAGDVITLVVLVLVIIIALVAWLAGLYDLRHPLPYDEEPAREVPDQQAIAADHCRKVHARRDAADLARGTSDNLVSNI